MEIESAAIVKSNPQSSESSETSSDGGTTLDRDQPFLFYRFSDFVPVRDSSLPPHYNWEIWRPRLLQIMPVGVADLRSRFAFRWLLHELRIFGNREYQVLVIRHLPSRLLAHYSGATGRYWRWPFMRPGDMQIGDTWTHPEHRGRGLASFGLTTLLERLARPGRDIWYVTELENPASMAVAEGAGMRLAGRGIRIKPRLMRLLDRYEILSPV